MKTSSRIFKRRRTGGRSRPYRGKRRYEMPGHPTETKVGEKEVKRKVRVRGGGTKQRLAVSQYANVSDPKTMKTKKVKVIDVIKSPASGDYDRRKIITRGSIIRTELGMAKVTSRPGQNGILNAVLIERK